MLTTTSFILNNLPNSSDDTDTDDRHDLFTEQTFHSLHAHTYNPKVQDRIRP
jgi:hypothetical protein